MNELKLEQPHASGDNLTASIDYEGMVSITVSEPWAGDTETGFGRDGTVRLNAEQALTLAAWLMKAAETLK